MSRKKLFALLVFVFTMLSVSVMAQSSVTPYQRKMAQVTLKYFNIFTFNPKKPQKTPMIEWLALTKSDPDAMGELVGVAALSYTQKHGAARTKQLMQQMAVEVKQAYKLRTKADVQRERNQASAEEKAKQEKAWKETDRYKITERVKQQLGAWCQKGEYEKAADVDERLRTQSEDKFVEICSDVMSNFEQVYPNTRVLGNYDSENERFQLVFNFKGQSQYFFTQGILGSCYYDVPIGDAEVFKERFQRFDQWDEAYRGGLYVILDWCFVNNMLVPKKLQMNIYPFGWTRPMELNFHKYDVDGNVVADLPSDSAAIFFDQLGIDNAYLEDEYYLETGDEAKLTTAEVEGAQERDDTVYDAGSSGIKAPTFCNMTYNTFAGYFDHNFVLPSTYQKFKNREKKNVVVSFVVEKDGSVSNVQLLAGVDPPLDNAALSFVKGMPKWNPATKKVDANRSYSVRFKVNIVFQYTYGPRVYVTDPKELLVDYAFKPSL